MPVIFPYVDVLLVTTVKAAALFSATVKCDIIAKAVSHKSLSRAGSQFPCFC